MAEKSADKMEREYIIPLRRHWLNRPKYERTGKAIKAIKEFIAKHMKVPERDTDKVKLDVYLNNDIWFKGRRHPPSKIKVRAVKEKDIVKVSFVEIPAHVKFLKAKHEKFRKQAEKKEEAKPEIKAEEKTEEQKKDEQEKGKAVEQANVKAAESQIKEQKHLTRVKEESHHRMALQK